MGNFVAYLILIALVGLRFFWALGLPLHPDEAYYWEWSRRLDWGYYDQGPLIAFTIRLFTSFLGDSQAALKFAAALISSVTLFLIYKTARQAGLSGRQTAVSLGLAFFVPGFFGGSLLIVHDTALLFFWCLALHLAVLYLRTRKDLLLYPLFVSIALGMLAKHTMVLFVPGLVLWLLLEREWNLLRKAHLWGAVLCAAVVCLPFLIWNLEHDWAQIDAILHLRSGGGAAGRDAGPGFFLTGQMLAFSPVWMLLFFIVCGVSLGALMRRASAPSSVDRPIRRLLWIQALLPFLFFLALSPGRQVQANWVFPAYPAMFVLLGGFWPEKGERSKHARAVVFLLWAGFPFALGLDLFTLYSAQIARISPVKLDTNWLPGYRTVGYGQILREVAEEMEKRDPEAALVTNRYLDAAIASWHLEGRPFVRSINIFQRNQYNYWPTPLSKGKDYFVLFIQENTCRKAEIFFEPVLMYMFEEVEAYPERSVMRDGREVKRYQLWHARNYRRHWQEPLLEYVNRGAILDMMPNLRGKSTGQTDPENVALLQEMVKNMYLARKGSLNCR